MSEAIPKLPRETHPEYIEVVKNEIRDHGNVVEFEFHFARPLQQTDVDRIWESPENTVSSTIWNKIKEKGWASDESTPEDLDVIAQFTRASPDRKVWTFGYAHDDPEASQSAR